MRRVVHLSDLHFGRTSPALLEPLLAEVAALTPDLVVISGDLTQRARVWQYAEAAAFIARLPQPVLCVPGNHDTPLDNLFLRMLNPWGRYRRYINRNLEPTFRDADLAVVGANTVNRFRWQQGRFSRRTLGRVLHGFADAGERTRIVVVHHPLEHIEGSAKSLTRGAGRALKELSAAGADIVLSGHIHTTHVGPFTSAPGLLFVQAGTGLSTRLRREENAFNVLDITPGRVTIRSIIADDTALFRQNASADFVQGPDGWAPA
ncbi:metallophosphoesterase [Fertoebacter nigrum]|uniref:Metallophosphoesterase n=1 Tax=Fertoeibacter niger TaxID=2656921 RepID=A0A8X8H1Q2_9RHOB|nr:metallophosphoesterase family protein [Fertoeibacter niger]NUB44639.1 metallophosphoesterase [Fertoeibacter niger]